MALYKEDLKALLHDRRQSPLDPEWNRLSNSQCYGQYEIYQQGPGQHQALLYSRASLHTPPYQSESEIQIHKQNESIWKAKTFS